MSSLVRFCRLGGIKTFKNAIKRIFSDIKDEYIIFNLFFVGATRDGFVQGHATHVHFGASFVLR